jgi:hypothetical protein
LVARRNPKATRRNPLPEKRVQPFLKGVQERLKYVEGPATRKKIEAAGRAQLREERLREQGKTRASAEAKRQHLLRMEKDARHRQKDEAGAWRKDYDPWVSNWRDSQSHEENEAIRRDRRTLNRYLGEGDRIHAALKERGWGFLPNLDCEEDTNWACLGADCRSLTVEGTSWVEGISWADPGGKWVTKPEDWEDLGRWAGAVPKSLYPWILLSNKIKFSLRERWNQNPKKVAAWLASRRPSRKALERKLDKYLVTLPTQHNWEGRKIPPWIASLGGWHAQNEHEMRTIGRPNHWCFGSTHHGVYADRITNSGESLYFIPGPEGLISLHTRTGSEDNWRDWVEVMHPKNKDATRDLRAMKANVKHLTAGEDWGDIEAEKLELKGSRRRKAGRRRSQKRVRVRANPLQKPTKNFAIAYTERDPLDHSVLRVLIADVSNPRKPLLVAGGIIQRGPRGTLVSDTMAAARGYGPLLYDAAATILKHSIGPSETRSDAAKKFWSRQGGQVQPLTLSAWQKKYGISLANLLRRGKSLTRQSFIDLTEEAGALAVDASEGEEMGVTVKVPWETRARANPLQKPRTSFGIAFKSWHPSESRSVLDLVIADLSKPKAQLVAGGIIEKTSGGTNFTSSMAASQGYGPLLYDAAATILGEAIGPSSERSREAEKFWAKQGDLIRPLTSEQWEKKYGISLRVLLQQGKSINPNSTFPALLRQAEDMALRAATGEYLGKPQRTTWEKRVRTNPHTSEWLVVTPHSSEWPLRRTAQVLVDWGYATGFSVRRTKEGKKQALAVTFDNVPEVRVSVPEPEPGAPYAIGSADRYESAVPTIQSYLRQYGKVKGYATMSRTNPVTTWGRKGRLTAAEVKDAIAYLLEDPLLTGLSLAAGTRYFNSQRRYKLPSKGHLIVEPPQSQRDLINKKALQSWRKLKAKKNPSKLGLKPLKGWDGDVYDPRDEAIRAVARGTEGKWGVAMGKYRREHSNAEIIQRSWERYQDPDEVLRDRQAYEVMLGKTRGSGPYRVTQEPTREGMRFFVWPLRIGQRVPKGYTTMRAAERRLAETYYDEAPKAALPSRKYTKKELSDWLPPDAAFKGRLGFPSRAKVTEIKKSRSTRSAPKKAETGLAAAYTRYRQDWKQSPRLVARFKKGKPPPRS